MTTYRPKSPNGDFPVSAGCWCMDDGRRTAVDARPERGDYVISDGRAHLFRQVRGAGAPYEMLCGAMSGAHFLWGISRVGEPRPPKGVTACRKCLAARPAYAEYWRAYHDRVFPGTPNPWRT